MKQFLIWNPDKVTQHLRIPRDEQSALFVLMTEAKSNGSVSSFIEAKDLLHARRLVEAFCNETDIELRTGQVPTELLIGVYNTEQYNGFSAAAKDGAVYYLGKPIKFNVLFTPSYMSLVHDAINLASKCLVDQHCLEVVVVDADVPDKLYAHLHDFSMPDNPAQ